MQTKNWNPGVGVSGATRSGVSETDTATLVQPSPLTPIAPSSSAGVGETDTVRGRVPMLNLPQRPATVGPAPAVPPTVAMEVDTTAEAPDQSSPSDHTPVIPNDVDDATEVMSVTVAGDQTPRTVLGSVLHGLTP